jgi:hypothetical protein
MKSDDANTRSVTVGIFNKIQDLERAVERLAAAGFEDTLYDEAIVALHAANVAPGWMELELVPGVFVELSGSVDAEVSSSVDAEVSSSVDAEEISSSVEPDLPTIVRAFKLHLADYHMSDEAIEDYAMAFYREGKVVLVKTGRPGDKEVVRILLKCGALQANRFDWAPSSSGAENSA